MRIFKTTKNNVDFLIMLIKHKNTNEYSFVNLTKEHICPCRFKSENEAINDLMLYRDKGKFDSFCEYSNISINAN